MLVRTGQVVDILFDVTNPGLWMAHCHIAEHLQSGMMFSFTVTRDERVSQNDDPIRTAITMEHARRAHAGLTTHDVARQPQT